MNKYASRLVCPKTVALLSREDKMIRPGLEPGTFCVLDRCDNQLRHRTAFRLPPFNQRKVPRLEMKPNI